MQIIAHTPEGIFYSKSYDGKECDEKNIEDILEIVAEGRSEYFKLETDDGVVVIGKELLTKSVFMLRKTNNEE